MMKTKLLLAAGLLPLSSLAQAHPAIHEGGFMQNLVHMLTEPDHLLLIGALGSLGYLLFRSVRKRS